MCCGPRRSATMATSVRSTLFPIPPLRIPGLYYHETEITPKVAGVYRIDSDGNSVTSFDKAADVRAIIEGQV